MTDAPTESSEQDTPAAEDAASAPVAETQEEQPQETEEPSTEPPEEDAAPSELDALKVRLEALEGVLAGKDEEIQALRDTAAKDALIRDAGLPSKYAQFLHGDEAGWAAQVADLQALTTKTPARPRDPAVDAQVGSDSEDRETAILRMFGLAE